MGQLNEFARQPKARRLCVIAACAFSFTGCMAAPMERQDAPATTATGTYERAFARWEDHMVTRGHQLGEKFIEQPFARLNAEPRAWYYDSQRVFLQIADHLGDPDNRWADYAERAGAAYQDYIQPNYGMPGYERFPHGLYLDWRRNGNADSRIALVTLRDHGPFADVTTSPWADGWYQQWASREVAYMLQTHVLTERAGEARQAEALRAYADRALTHVDSWTSEQYLTDDPKWQFCQAFMAGLTASALIDYHTLTGDARVPRALQRLGDWLAENMWVEQHPIEGTYDWHPRHYGAFRYIRPAIEGIGGESPAPDLNLLIVPLYGWLYRETGEVRYREIGDLAFAGGVAFAYLATDKNYNQNYRSSFDYVAWRAEGLKRWEVE